MATTPVPIEKANHIVQVPRRRTFIEFISFKPLQTETLPMCQLLGRMYGWKYEKIQKFLAKTKASDKETFGDILLAAAGNNKHMMTFTAGMNILLGGIREGEPQTLPRDEWTIGLLQELLESDATNMDPSSKQNILIILNLLTAHPVVQELVFG
jgi:hypothetical protein